MLHYSGTKQGSVSRIIVLRAEVKPTIYYTPDELKKARRLRSKCRKCSKAATRE